MCQTGAIIDPEASGRFAARSRTWWDPAGSFRALHWINPTRLGFIRQHLQAHFGCEPSSLRPFEGLSLLDIGCGGGLIAEPMARLGFAVTGIDADAEAVAAARSHAREMGLAIDYRLATAEIAGRGRHTLRCRAGARSDRACCRSRRIFCLHRRLGTARGAFVGATLNRTAAIFRLGDRRRRAHFPMDSPGTHDWRKFLRPSEFILGLRRNGLSTTRLTGVVYDPWRGKWSLAPDLGVNYMVAATRR